MHRTTIQLYIWLFSTANTWLHRRFSVTVLTSTLLEALYVITKIIIDLNFC